MSSRRSKRRRRTSRVTKNSGRAKQTAPGIDVVVPVFGHFDLLEQGLKALSDADKPLPMEVWIIDDGSTPALTQEYLSSLDLDLNFHLRRSKLNRGFIQTTNFGVHLGNHELVLLLNSDVVLDPQALNYLAEEFQDPQMGVVGCRLLFREDSRDPHRPAGTIQHAGMAINFSGQPFHIHIGWPADHPRANVRREMQLVTGACFMTRRDVWRKIGGFADVYGKGTFEDAEYCVATRTLGLKVLYQPKAKGYHFVGGSVVNSGEGFPVIQNRMIWKLRCGELVYWDEWRFW